MAEEAKRLTAAIRGAVEAYDEAGYRQWYVDENAIDCDADEFWRITEAALAKALEDAPELHQLRMHADHDRHVAAVERERIRRRFSDDYDNHWAQWAADQIDQLDA